MLNLTLALASALTLALLGHLPDTNFILSTFEGGLIFQAIAAIAVYTLCVSSWGSIWNLVEFLSDTLTPDNDSDNVGASSNDNVGASAKG